MELEIGELEIKSDDRGFVTELLTSKKANSEIKEVLFIVSKPGVTRGNHYHKSKAEWICIIKGKAKLVYEDNVTGERREVIVSGDKPTVISTPTNVMHWVENIGDDDLYTIEITNHLYEEGPDTFRK